jgi:hypothetical protein
MDKDSALTQIFDDNPCRMPEHHEIREAYRNSVPPWIPARGRRNDLNARHATEPKRSQKAPPTTNLGQRREGVCLCSINKKLQIMIKSREMMAR